VATNTWFQKNLRGTENVYCAEDLCTFELTVFEGHDGGVGVRGGDNRR